MKIQHVSLIPTVCSRISFFCLSLFFLLSFQRSGRKKLEIIISQRLRDSFPRRGIPSTVGRGKEGKHIRGLPRCALIFKVASEICRFWRINTEGRRERALEDPVPS